MIVTRFYKYLDIIGAKATLADCRIKLSIPSEFDDVFDINPANLPFFDLDQRLSQTSSEALELLRNDPSAYAAWYGVDDKEAHHASRHIPLMSAGQLDSLKKMADIVIKPMREVLLKQTDEILKQYKTAAVFCASEIYDDNKMWALYAGKHTGVVFGFTPNPDNDSVLTVLKPVIYASEPPTVFPTGLKQIDKEQFLKFASQLYLCKDKAWEYQKEVRLYIPSEIIPPAKFTFMKFPPDELTDVYFGCRVSEADEREIKNLATALNPNIKIHHAKIVTGHYELEFQETSMS